MSKKVTLSADGATATVTEATLTDVFTTAISQNEAVMGLYGLAQKAGLVVTGMAVQNYRVGRGINPFA